MSCSYIFKEITLCTYVNRISLIVLKFYQFIFEAYSEAYVHDPNFEEVYQRLTSSRSNYEGMETTTF